MVLIAIGPDGPGEFGRFWRANRIPFVGIPDAEHKVARLFRQEVNLFKLGRMPLVTILDTNGLIQYSHRAESMSDIPSNATLLEIVERIRASSSRPAYSRQFSSGQ